MNKIIPFIILLFISVCTHGQGLNDTIAHSIDTTNNLPAPALKPIADTVAKKNVALPVTEYQRVGKEWLFYGLLLLLIVFAIMRQAFSKYFDDLFRLFFRTTLKLRQLRDQLVQMPLPALLMNIFFAITGGFYLAFIFNHYGINPLNNFWLLALYAIIGLAGAYLVKYIGLKMSGWLFGMREAADSYIFIVFTINKMMGILLLPFLILLAFSTDHVYTAALVMSWCMLGILLGYRFILTYTTIRNQVRVNLFHFFLYLLAVEIAPLLLVYKALLLFFDIK